MDTLFIYNKSVNGQDFIGRDSEINQLYGSIKDKLEKKTALNPILYAPPKSGKNSLIEVVIDKLSKNNTLFTLTQINLFNVRTEKLLLKKICSNILNSHGVIKEQQQIVIAELAPLAEQLFIKSGNADIDHLPVDDKIIEQVFDLPERIAQEYGTNPLIYIQEFQEILLFDDSYKILKILERVISKHTNVCYIISGSLVNAMKSIFEEQKFFYGSVKRIELNPLGLRESVQFLNKAFLKTGRVISPQLATKLYNYVDGDPWYLQQLGELSYSSTRGFLTEGVLKQAFDCLMELHSYRFRMITSRLTRYQISFIKAILDNNLQLCSSETMIKYGFNSSANVKRLRDAVKKKELLTQHQEEWIFLDPLFKKWLKEVYFN